MQKAFYWFFPTWYHGLLEPWWAMRSRGAALSTMVHVCKVHLSDSVIDAHSGSDEKRHIVAIWNNWIFVVHRTHGDKGKVEKETISSLTTSQSSLNEAWTAAEKVIVEQYLKQNIQSIYVCFSRSTASWRIYSPFIHVDFCSHFLYVIIFSQ